MKESRGSAGRFRGKLGRRAGEIDSTIGQGTEIRLLFPALSLEEDEEEDEPNQPPCQPGASGSPGGEPSSPVNPAEKGC